MGTKMARAFKWNQICKQTWRLHASAQFLSHNREVYLTRVKRHRYFPVMSTILTVKDQKFTQRLHNIRNASGRFRKVEAIETRKETKIKRLHGGFKTWNAKRKLQYDNISKENEPPAKRMTRAREVSTFFFIRKS